MNEPVCPKCRVSNWDRDREPVGAWGCQNCGSHLCPANVTGALIKYVNVDPHEMGMLARETSHPGPCECPTCAQGMVVFDLMGAQMHACLAHGVSFFDPGEFERLVPDSPPLLLGDGSGLELDLPARPGAPTDADFLPPGAAAPAPGAPLAISAAGGSKSSTPGTAADPGTNATGVAGVDDFLSGPQGEAFFSHVDHVQIRAAKKVGEYLGIEQKNDYAVDAGTSGIGHAAEDGGGVGGVLMRQIMGARRPIQFVIRDPHDQPRYVLKRPFFWFMSRMSVTAAENGRPVGDIRRRFVMLGNKYDLKDGRGRLFSQIRAGFWRIRKFPLVDVKTGTEHGHVTKQFAGLQEFLSDADNFHVVFGDGAKTDDERAVVIASALNIDLDFFEKSSSNKSPIKMIISAAVFLFMLVFGIPNACDDGPGMSRPELLENARACFSTAAGVADCDGCCTLGSVFDESGCHCTGIIVECPDGAGPPGDLPGDPQADAACSACCVGALTENYVVEAWLDDEAKCRCEAAYNVDVFK